MNRNGNAKNLIPMDARTEDEQRKIASEGGKASGLARRSRAELRAELDALLAHRGVQKKVCLALIGKALQGDVRAFEVIRDTVEGKPNKRVKDVNPADNEVRFTLTVVDEQGREIDRDVSDFAG